MKAKDLKKFLENLDEEEVVFKEYESDQEASKIHRVDVKTMCTSPEEQHRSFYDLDLKEPEDTEVRCVVFVRYK